MCCSSSGDLKLRGPVCTWGSNSQGSIPFVRHLVLVTIFLYTNRLYVGEMVSITPVSQLHSSVFPIWSFLNEWCFQSAMICTESEYYYLFILLKMKICIICLTLMLSYPPGSRGASDKPLDLIKVNGSLSPSLLVCHPPIPTGMLHRDGIHWITTVLDFWSRPFRALLKSANSALFCSLGLR